MIIMLLNPIEDSLRQDRSPEFFRD